MWLGQSPVFFTDFHFDDLNEINIYSLSKSLHSPHDHWQWLPSCMLVTPVTFFYQKHSSIKQLLQAPYSQPSIDLLGIGRWVHLGGPRFWWSRNGLGFGPLVLSLVLSGVAGGTSTR
jgi:hypothetical protein